jgi:nitrite reductase/ring-hydroxylating ferredoxin subunit
LAFASAIGLLALASVAVAGLIVASSAHHRGTATIWADGLVAGTAMKTRFTIASAPLRRAPVFLARERDGHLVAFLGRSTHLGCAVALANDPRWPRFKQPPNVAFEDPCGGSTWDLEGDCVAGPCPRGLSTFLVTIKGASVQIDLSRTVAGKPRASD